MVQRAAALALGEPQEAQCAMGIVVAWIARRGARKGGDGLARRAAERRMSRKPVGKPSRKRAAFENSIEQEEGKLPSANRPACYLA